MSATLDPPTAVGPPRPVRWIGLRLGLLIAVLLVLNVTVVEGWREIFVHLSWPTGLWPLFFGIGWGAFLPVLLGLWLAWGSGRLITRLVLVLAVAALGVALPTALQLEIRTVFDRLAIKGVVGLGFQSFLGELLMYYLLIFALQLLLMPLPGLLGWQFSFSASAEAKSRRGANWSLFDVMGYIAFAAFALAFIRLFNLWLTVGGKEDSLTWLMILLESLLPLATAAAAAIAVFAERLSWLWRIAALPLALITIFACRYAYDSVTGLPLASIWSSAASSAGVVCAAFANLALIRLAGVRLWRQVDRVARASVDA
jgi:hypothetical protein